VCDCFGTAEAVPFHENWKGVVAAMNRCATQNQRQDRAAEKNAGMGHSRSSEERSDPSTAQKLHFVKFCSAQDDNCRRMTAIEMTTWIGCLKAES
jgi:hypothetical protein